MPYVYIFVLLFCMAFFVKGAQLAERSSLVWGGLSLLAWIVVTQFFIGGIGGRLLSQVVLFGGMTAFGLIREELCMRRGSPTSDCAPASGARQSRPNASESTVPARRRSA